MTDKERILTLIIDRLSLTQTLALRGTKESQFLKDSEGRDEYVHFGAYDDRPIQKGDLVLARTGSINDFKIGWVHQVVSSDTCIIREIGSTRLCNYSNESFTRIAGLHPSLLLEGEEYIFKQKVIKAFRKGDEYWYRFGGIEFTGNEVKIYIREAFGGLNKPSNPFYFMMKWNKRTSVKRILETMREHGYGTREFDKVEQEVTAAQVAVKQGGRGEVGGE